MTNAGGRQNLAAVLSTLLPESPNDYIFGRDGDATVESAIEQSKCRAVPEISVYVVSSNDGQAEKLQRLFETIPSKFCLLSADVFFPKEKGRYESMGADRCAALAGAAHLYGHPALVFDGGTATTYSATDCYGKILGGGIGPGLRAKLKSLAETTSALPDISGKVDAMVNDACGDDGDGPLPIFAKNTEHAILGDVLRDFALKGRSVIKKWLQNAYSDDYTTTNNNNYKHNSQKKVLCTGGDGETLDLLLCPGAGGVIEMNDDEESSLEYEVETQKHLIHYGVTFVLYNGVKLQQRRDEFSKKKGDAHVGIRVAKVFDVEDDEGDNIYRGTVKEVKDVDGQKEYQIIYDDGDVEDVSMETLFREFQFSIIGFL